jgi:hypothetical protein
MTFYLGGKNYNITFDGTNVTFSYGGTNRGTININDYSILRYQYYRRWEECFIFCWWESSSYNQRSAAYNPKIVEIDGKPYTFYYYRADIADDKDNVYLDFYWLRFTEVKPCPDDDPADGVDNMLFTHADWVWWPGWTTNAAGLFWDKEDGSDGAIHSVGYSGGNWNADEEVFVLDVGPLGTSYIAGFPQEYYLNMSVGIYGHQGELTDERTGDIIAIAGTDIFEDADAAHQLIERTLSAHANMSWDGSTFTNSSGFLSYNIDFSSDPDMDIPMAMFRTDTYGTNYLRQLADVEKITAHADIEKSLIKVVNNVKERTTYILYSKDGQKEFLIEIDNALDLSSFGMSEYELSDEVALRMLKEKFQNGTLEVKEEESDPAGFYRVEFNNAVKHDSGFKEITAESWSQGINADYSRQESGGVATSIGRTEYEQTNVLSSAGKVLSSHVNKKETYGTETDIATDYTRMASYDSFGQLMSQTSLKLQGSCSDITMAGKDFGLRGQSLTGILSREENITKNATYDSLGQMVNMFSSNFKTGTFITSAGLKDARIHDDPEKEYIYVETLQEGTVDGLGRMNYYDRWAEHTLRAATGFPIVPYLTYSGQIHTTFDDNLGKQMYDSINQLANYIKTIEKYGQFITNKMNDDLTALIRWEEGAVGPMNYAYANDVANVWGFGDRHPGADWLMQSPDAINPGDPFYTKTITQDANSFAIGWPDYDYLGRVNGWLTNTDEVTEMRWYDAAVVPNVYLTYNRITNSKSERRRGISYDEMSRMTDYQH